mmetsp:Transcript_4551/g.7185  ORF Transcript_4551/g.7185 Transcript_4551/m.7185 type:complete len:94 (-) Transcript_4551:15-296(-)
MLSRSPKKALGSWPISAASSLRRLTLLFYSDSQGLSDGGKFIQFDVSWVPILSITPHTRLRGQFKIHKMSQIQTSGTKKSALVSLNALEYLFI